MTRTKKALALITFGAGYVVGTRAGRERYEQIRRLARGVKEEGSAGVHKAADEVASQVSVPFNANATP